MKKKAVALILIVLIITTIAVYLAGSTLRAIYENKNLQREKDLSVAKAASLAGLEKAFLILNDDFKSSGNWSDGDIEGISVIPDPSNKEKKFDFISENLDNGASFNVKIQFIFDASNNPYKGRLWIYSTGSYNETSFTFKRLALASYVYNQTQKKYYPDLQSAINDANSGDKLLVAKGMLQENIIINKNLTIEFGYDYDFTHRDPSIYQTIITPQDDSTYTLEITDGNITLGGGKIE